MGYINTLQNENAELKTKMAAAEEELNNLRLYLESDKFRCGDELDQYVNIRDVLSRIERIDLTAD